MNNTNHKTMLSEHFSLNEMTYSRIAVEQALDNTPSPAVLKNLQHLVSHLLEPLRNLYKKPIAILSGYRSETVNRQAGGVARSQHLKGEAADCYTPDAAALFDTLKRSGLTFDQAILYRKRNFLHLSLKAEGYNRMQILLFLLCTVFLLCGCGVRTKNKTQQWARHLDTASFSSLQHLDSYTGLRLIDSITWEIKQVVLSPPDTAGRQYPETITLLQATRHSERSDSTHTAQTQKQQYTQQQSESTYAEATTTTTSRKRIFLLLTGLSVLIGITAYLLYKRS